MPSKAISELYTIHALEGHQLLGAYSQYGWHHPGPLLFYCFAPFYALTGQSTLGIDASALFINLLSIALIGWIVGRAEDASLAFVGALFGLLVVYVMRVPNLLTSGWNAHTPVLPLLALIVVTASNLAHVRRSLPIAALLATFVAQSHVGLAVVACGLMLAIVAALSRTAVTRPNLRYTVGWLAVGTILLLEVLWAAPLAEQIVNEPGNMTRIWRFLDDARGQPAMTAWGVWSRMLLGVFTPGFILADGGNSPAPASLGPLLAATGIVAALIPTSILHWRRGCGFLSALAATCFGASVLGLWSVLGIRGVLLDHQVFWLSALGIMNVAVVGAGAAAAAQVIDEQVRRLVVRACVVAGIVAISTVGIYSLISGGHAPLGMENRMVQQLSSQLARSLPSLGGRHPVVRLGDGLLSVGAGVVLQLKRAGGPLAVAPEMVWLFGNSLAQTGNEDVLITISRTNQHLQLAARPRNITVAEYGGVFIDAVSLHDEPQFRP